MSVDLSKVGNCRLKNASTGEMVEVKSLWQDQTCVIIFFRRWGCIFCRVWAKQINALAPTFKEHNIRLIGVGVEELGLEDFQKGKYFDGDLFIDTEKTVYSALNFKRFSTVGVLLRLLTSESRSAISKGRTEKLGGDLKGDGLQNGGVLVVKAGGELLYSFRQERPAEHIENAKFAEILKIKAPPEALIESEKMANCDNDVCSR